MPGLFEDLRPGPRPPGLLLETLPQARSVLRSSFARRDLAARRLASYAVTRVEIILRALNLSFRTKGRRAWLLCPFHDDRSPTNFFVRPYGERAGNFHCYSCGAKGRLVDLVAKVRGCDGRQAKAFVDSLGFGHRAPEICVTVARLPSSPGRRRFKMPIGFVGDEPVSDWPTPIGDYLLERGILEEQVARFGIGYAVDGRLSGRIVIPFRDYPSGRPQTYSARTFADQDPRYLTPHESEGADLGVLFGEHLWPPYEARGTVFVTEGAIDALAVERASGGLVAALGGSDVKSGHVLSLSTFEKVVLMTDADEPGDAAAVDLRLRLGQECETLRLRLPPETDAASLPPERLREIVHTFIARMP